MINIAAFVFNPFRENTYVVSSESGQCMIVDPGNSTPSEDAMLVNYIDTNNLTPIMIIATHAHIDHVLGVDMLKERYKIPFAVSSDDQQLLDNLIQHGEMYGMAVDAAPVADVDLKGMAQLKLGEDVIDIIPTPGHSKGGVCLFVKKQNVILTGDTLFRESIGRTDLPGGDYKALMTSLLNNVVRLGDNVSVHPGHGEVTTIGHEMLYNPFVVEVINGEVNY